MLGMTQARCPAIVRRLSLSATCLCRSVILRCHTELAGVLSKDTQAGSLSRKVGSSKPIVLYRLLDISTSLRSKSCELGRQAQCPEYVHKTKNPPRRIFIIPIVTLFYLKRAFKEPQVRGTTSSVDWMVITSLSWELPSIPLIFRR